MRWGLALLHTLPALCNTYSMSAADLSSGAGKAPKVALVTGGSRGIGKGICESLAEVGYDVLLAFNTDAAAAEATASELRHSYGVRAACVGGDVCARETRDAIFRAIDENFGGKVNVMVHNAGQNIGVTADNTEQLERRILRFGDGSMVDKESGEVDFRYMNYYMRLYGEAWVDLMERSLARMPDNAGHVVGISAQGCNPNVSPHPGYDMNGAGKATMEYTMRLAAANAAPRGININCIVPGVTLTEAWARLSAQSGGPKDLSRVEGWARTTVPMQRAATPKEIGDVVRFLCSKEGSYITGVVLPVDGGMHIGAKNIQASEKKHE